MHVLHTRDYVFHSCYNLEIIVTWLVKSDLCFM